MNIIYCPVGESMGIARALAAAAGGQAIEGCGGWSGWSLGYANVCVNGIGREDCTHQVRETARLTTRPVPPNGGGA